MTLTINKESSTIHRFHRQTNHCLFLKKEIGIILNLTRSSCRVHHSGSAMFDHCTKSKFDTPYKKQLNRKYCQDNHNLADFMNY
jgi:hypothetical protein